MNVSWHSRSVAMADFRNCGKSAKYTLRWRAWLLGSLPLLGLMCTAPAAEASPATFRLSPSGLQTYTASVTGGYNIVAIGANGGVGLHGGFGGIGALVGGDFNLTAGEQMQIFVGGNGAAGGLVGPGLDQYDATLGGGGGGTFVIAPGNLPLLIAGGGGGGGGYEGNPNGAVVGYGGSALAGTSGGPGVAGTPGFEGTIGLAGAGGTNGGGGGAGFDEGGGGGGFTGPGGNGTRTPGGASFPNFTPISAQLPGNGGYGGGGGGSTGQEKDTEDLAGAGGGGGYSGGGGGYVGGGGGGGGSFNGGSNQMFLVGDDTQLGASVTITPLSGSASVPEPASIALLGLGLAGVLAGQRRARSGW